MSEPTASLAPYALRCEHRDAALGVDEPAPLLSWRLGSGRRGDAPAYRIRVETEEGTLVWDTGTVADPEAVGVRYAGDPLLPRTRYRWTVEVTAQDGGAREAGTPTSRTSCSAAPRRRRGSTRCGMARPPSGSGVPPGASALVDIPAADPDGVRENGVPVAAATGVQIVGTEPGTLRCRVTSGEFRCTADFH